MSRIATGFAALVVFGVSGTGLTVLTAGAEPPKGPAPEARSGTPRLDLYGDPLPPEAMARLGTVRFRHGGSVQSIAFSSDGRTLVTGAEDGFRAWDTGTGKLRSWFGRLSQPLLSSCLDVSEDGKFAVTGVNRFDEDEPAGVGLWDLETGSLVRRFGDGNYCTVRLSADGSRVAAVKFEGTGLEAWEVKTGKKVCDWPLPGLARDVLARSPPFAFSPDAKILVTGGIDKKVRVWDVSTGKVVHQTESCPADIGMLAVSPDGAFFATVGQARHTINEVRGVEILADDFVWVWDLRTAKRLHQLGTPSPRLTGDAYYAAGGNAYVYAMAFTRDGKKLLTGGFKIPSRVWDPATGKELARLPDSGSETPYPSAVSPDGRTGVYVEELHSLSLRDLSTGKHLHTTNGHTYGVWSTAVSPDGKYVATAASELPTEGIRIWEIVTSRECRKLTRPGFVQRVTWAETGRVLLSEGFEEDNSGNIIHVWDEAAGRVSRSFKPEKLRTSACSRDGKFVAAASGTRVEIIAAETGKTVRTLTGAAHPLEFLRFAVNDGRTLYGQDERGMVYKWDAETGKELTSFRIREDKQGFERTTESTVKAANSRLLAIAETDGCVLLRETTEGRVVRRLTGPGGPAVEGFRILPGENVAFSPDGRTLAWGGTLRQPGIWLYEVASGKLRHRLAGHMNAVYSLSFTADGKTLVSGGSDTTGLVWDLTGRLELDKGKGKPLTTDELKRCWADLAGDNAERAYQAIRRLAADPASAGYLLNALPPVKAAGDREVDRPSDKEEWSESPARLREARAIETLELAGTADARRTLQAWAGGASGVWLTRDARDALARLDKRRVAP